MPLIGSTEKLLDVMKSWAESGIKGGVVLVDEDTKDFDASKDREGCHKHMATVIQCAVALKMPVFVVKFGPVEAFYGPVDDFEGGLGPVLDSVIPSGTRAFSKRPDETDGFENYQLCDAVKAKGVTDIIIMGQSVNACCAATAKGAVRRKLKIHTCQLLVRGGNYATEAIGSWPDGTTVYQAV